MIPLMENKMKWDRTKKEKKKKSGMETEMCGTHRSYNVYDENPVEGETSIPMFQVWTSKENGDTPSPNRRFAEHSFIGHSGDSGIESVQASPAQKLNNASSSIVDIYDVPGPSTPRRYSSVYLHPDRARSSYNNPVASTSRENHEIEVYSEYQVAGGDGGVGGDMSGASSNASSLTSVHGASGSGARNADPWGRRRSSTWTGRYSDTVDPEFANARMASRGSVGMHSLSDSLHRLTFTQSLAFPELARKLANRRRQEQLRATINDTRQDDLEACSKFIAVAGVFLLSIMVYGVVNRYGKA